MHPLYSPVTYSYVVMMAPPAEGDEETGAWADGSFNVEVPTATGRPKIGTLRSLGEMGERCPPLLYSPVVYSRLRGMRNRGRGRMGHLRGGYLRRMEYCEWGRYEA
jgi:hypothetical protein